MTTVSDQITPERPLRVLVVPHAPYALVFGGMEVQQLQTILALESVGVEVVRFDPWMTEYNVDIIHVFGTEHSHTDIIDRARLNGFPVISVAMFMPERPLWHFQIMRMLQIVLPKTTFELRQRSMLLSNRVISISGHEKEQIAKGFGIERSHISIIPNGIEERFFHASPDLFSQRYNLDGIVLCVANVESRKNQLQVARALRGLNKPVVFIGRANDAAYGESFREEIDANENMYWIEGIQHNDPLLASAFASADVHILASIAEAQGLTSMEAYAAGAHVIVSDLPQLRTCFGADVEYVDPTNSMAIRKCVEKLLATPKRVATTSRPKWLLYRLDV